MQHVTTFICTNVTSRVELYGSITVMCYMPLWAWEEQGSNESNMVDPSLRWNLWMSWIGSLPSPRIQIWLVSPPLGGHSWEL